MIGNGTSSAARSDALVMLKDGSTTLNGALTINTTSTTASYTLPVGGGSNGQVLSMLDATTGTTTWTTVAGGASTGLVSVTENGNSGYRLALEPAANHGDIGDDAIDLSIQDISSSRGATGDFSFTAGRRTTASGLHSTAFGTENSAPGNYSTAFGNGTFAIGNYSTAFGRSTTASGSHATTWGWATSATSSYTTAWGAQTTASGNRSTAWGNNTTASGDYSTAMGNNTTAAGSASVAMGEDSTSSGAFSVVMGGNTTAESFGQTTIGTYNTTQTGNATTFVPSDRLFVIGNGTGTAVADRSDAMVILKNGNVGIGDSTPTEGTLVVSGTIVSSGSITANQTLTPDYVFEQYFNGTSEANPAYRFPSLAEVEAFVKENHHLPNVASAAEVKEQGGIVLNRASEVQLEKIEELYLHTIEQEKKIEAQSKLIEQLIARLEALEKKE